MNSKASLALAALILALAASCAPVLLPGKDGGTAASVQGRAMVSIRLDGSSATGLAARTILPQSPTITNYVLFGTPAGGAELELAGFVHPVPQGAAVAIEPGLWLFRLEARDQAGKVVLEAPLGSTDIAASSAVALTFYLRPVDAGTGTMTVVLGLPDGNLVKLAKVVLDGAVVLDGTGAEYVLEPVSGRLAFSKALDYGDHIVSFRMLDASGRLLAVVSELMRIRRNLTSLWSRDVPAGAFNAAPASPTPLSVTRILSEASAGTVDLEWTRVSDNETGFVITWTDDLNVSGILNVGPGRSSYVWTAAPRGRSYSFKIQAVNDFGSPVAASWSGAIAVPALIFKDLQINVEMGTAAAITFASGATVPRGTALVASLTGTFASYAWYLDGVSMGSSVSISIATSALSGSQHELMVRVRQSATGEYSSAAMTFRVTTPALP